MKLPQYNISNQLCGEITLHLRDNMSVENENNCLLIDPVSTISMRFPSFYNGIKYIEFNHGNEIIKLKVTAEEQNQIQLWYDLYILEVCQDHYKLVMKILTRQRTILLTLMILGGYLVYGAFLLVKTGAVAFVWIPFLYLAQYLSCIGNIKRVKELKKL